MEVGGGLPSHVKEMIRLFAKWMQHDLATLKKYS
jgi:hypothetical protein